MDADAGPRVDDGALTPAVVDAAAASPLLAELGTTVERDSALETLDTAPAEREQAAAATEAERARAAAEAAAARERGRGREGG